MIRLFETPPQIRGMEVSMEALTQADLIAARFMSGEAKIGTLPANVAAKIASGGKQIQIAAVINLGMLNLLTSDDAIRTIEDLRGQRVEVTGQGATPDYVFRRILISHGLNPDRDLQLNYALAYPEIAQSLIAGRVSIALLPEPFASMAKAGNPALRNVADIQAEWSIAGGSGNYPMAVLVVDSEFARTYPDAVRTILGEIRDSIQWVNANPAEAGALVEKHEWGLRAPMISAAVPRSNYVYIPAQEARSSIEALFKVFLEFAPVSIGGVLPPDRFYFNVH
jgi:NitT/TauT family transport system substrate-binding protein